MITTQSRYVNGRLFVADEVVYVERTFPPLASRTYRWHIWSAADRLDVLAARYYGDAKQWWRLLDLNPLIQSPDDIRPGMRLRVPDA